MPDLSFVDEFKKSHLEPTKPKPYNLRVDSRGQEKWRKLNEKVRMTFVATCLLCLCIVYEACMTLS